MYSQKLTPDIQSQVLSEKHSTETASLWPEENDQVDDGTCVGCGRSHQPPPPPPPPAPQRQLGWCAPAQQPSDISKAHQPSRCSGSTSRSKNSQGLGKISFSSEKLGTLRHRRAGVGAAKQEGKSSRLAELMTHPKARGQPIPSTWSQPLPWRRGHCSPNGDSHWVRTPQGCHGGQ